MDFGKAIKQVRKEKKIKQKELSDITGLSVNAISEIELGKSIPQKETLNKIVKGLDIPKNYLFFLCLTEDDVPDSKKSVFRVLKNSLSDLILEINK